MNTRIKWLVLVVSLLVVCNIALLAMMWWRKDHRQNGFPAGRNGDARNYLITALSLDARQVQSFDSLRKDHFQRVRTYQDSIRKLKDALFDQLPNAQHLQADSIAGKIGGWQTKMELETFQHFAQLRSLLSVAQTQKFDAVIQDVLRTMAPPGRHRPGGPLPPGAIPDQRGDGPPPPGR